MDDCGRKEGERAWKGLIEAERLEVWVGSRFVQRLGQLDMIAKTGAIGCYRREVNYYGKKNALLKSKANESDHARCVLDDCDMDGM